MSEDILVAQSLENLIYKARDAGDGVMSRFLVEYGKHLVEMRLGGSLYPVMRLRTVLERVIELDVSRPLSDDESWEYSCCIGQIGPLLVAVTTLPDVTCRGAGSE